MRSKILNLIPEKTAQAAFHDIAGLVQHARIMVANQTAAPDGDVAEKVSRNEIASRPASSLGMTEALMTADGVAVGEIAAIVTETTETEAVMSEAGIQQPAKANRAIKPVTVQRNRLQRTAGSGPVCSMMISNPSASMKLKIQIAVTKMTGLKKARQQKARRGAVRDVDEADVVAGPNARTVATRTLATRTLATRKTAIKAVEADSPVATGMKVAIQRNTALSHAVLSIGLNPFLMK